jgi:hypothetical protein
MKANTNGFGVASRSNHKPAALTFIAAVLCGIAASCACQLALADDERIPVVAAPLDYSRDIRPILSGNCFRCHGPDQEKREAELRLDTFDGATEKLSDGQAVVPGEPDASHLMKRILSNDADVKMPPPETG